MRINEIVVRQDALVMLTAAVAGHLAGGELRTQLQPDWSDGADCPTIVVRIGNHVTVKQAGTYLEAAEAMLAWVGGLPKGEPAVLSAARADRAMYHTGVDHRANP